MCRRIISAAVKSRRCGMAITLLTLTFALSGCGGGGNAGTQSAVASDPGGMNSSMGSGSGQGSAAGNAYTVGGTVTGLSGTGLVLQINGGQDLAVAQNGTVMFPTPLMAGSSYAVTVLSQPGTYREICGVSNGSGTVMSADVTDVTISCSIAVGFIYDTVDDQIYSYGISPGTGMPVPFGSPVPTANVPVGTTDRPTALVTSPNGAFLYVSNALEAGNEVDPSFSGVISIYAVDAASGTLTQTGSLDLPGVSPQGMSMSPSGFLFVYSSAVQGTPPNQTESWSLTTYYVDPSGGALTQVGTPLTSNSQLGFVATADGQRLYVLAGDLASNTPSPVTVTAYAIDPSTGVLTAGPILNLESSWGGNSLSTVMAIDPLGRYLYLVSSSSPPPNDSSTATVLTYAIDPPTGALSASATGTPVAGNGGGLIADPSGKYLYMLNSFNVTSAWDGVMAMAVDETSGTVTPLGSQLPVSGQPEQVLCDPSGQFVYVSNFDAAGSDSSWAALAGFTISAAPATAGQLVSSGLGTLEQPLSYGGGMAVVE